MFVSKITKLKSERSRQISRFYKDELVRSQWGIFSIFCLNKKCIAGFHKNVDCIPDFAKLRFECFCVMHSSFVGNFCEAVFLTWFSQMQVGTVDWHSGPPKYFSGNVWLVIAYFTNRTQKVELFAMLLTVIKWRKWNFFSSECFRFEFWKRRQTPNEGNVTLNCPIQVPLDSTLA